MRKLTNFEYYIKSHFYVIPKVWQFLQRMSQGTCQKNGNYTLKTFFRFFFKFAWNLSKFPFHSHITQIGFPFHYFINHNCIRQQNWDRRSRPNRPSHKPLWTWVIFDNHLECSIVIAFIWDIFSVFNSVYRLNYTDEKVVSYELILKFFEPMKISCL